MSQSKDTGHEKTAATIENETSDHEGRVVETVLAMPSRLGRSVRDADTPESAGVDRIYGIVIGHLKRISGQGRVEVAFPKQHGQESVPAITTVGLTLEDMGREVALAFVDGDPARPIILGLVQHPIGDRAEVVTEKAGEKLDVQVDGERVTLTADREIVLKCGKASITLTRAGKVIVKGEYVSTHSTGVNRIKGGSVQLN